MARRSFLFRHLVLLAGCAAMSSCGSGGGDVFEVTLVGDPGSQFAQGVKMPPAARQLRAATADGLVGFDEQGEVVPGLAERWIVTDDGRSYIFRLAERNWPDGSPITGESVRDALRKAQRETAGTSFALDLAKISDIRAMTGRVVEIRLVTPMPEFLKLLAQPELGLLHKGKATGHMRLQRQGDAAILSAVPPQDRGEPAESGWSRHVRKLRVISVPAARAIERFNQGETDIVLGGELEDLPMADTGPLSRGTVRLDSVLGLLGLQVTRAEGFLADPARREALAMAIDRAAIIAPFNIGGWTPTSRIVPPGLPGDLGTIGERWSGMTLDQRRREAARRVADWRAGNGGEAPVVMIALPAGPGADIVFASLKADFAQIGVQASRAGAGAPADLRLIDVVARIADPRWFLNQFNCGLQRGLCSAAADARVAEAVKAVDSAAESGLLAEAEAELTAANVYIPIGAPVRWSLVRGDITGFAPNKQGFHPLLPLAMLPR